MFDVSYCSMMNVKVFYLENEDILLKFVSKTVLFSQFVLNLVQLKPNVHLKSQILFYTLYVLFLKGAPIQKSFESIFLCSSTMKKYTSFLS